MNNLICWSNSCLDFFQHKVYFRKCWNYHRLICDASLSAVISWVTLHWLLTILHAPLRPQQWYGSTPGTPRSLCPICTCKAWDQSSSWDVLPILGASGGQCSAWLSRKLLSVQATSPPQASSQFPRTRLQQLIMTSTLWKAKWAAGKLLITTWRNKIF